MAVTQNSKSISQYIILNPIQIEPIRILKASLESVTKRKFLEPSWPHAVQVARKCHYFVVFELFYF